LTTPQLIVILPTYNERQSIKPLILAIWQGIKPPPEIIVVDDDSPDKTWEVVAELQHQVPQLKLHRRIRLRGLATAIAEGITLSTGDVLTWMDCGTGLRVSPGSFLVKFTAISRSLFFSLKLGKIL